MSAGDLQGSTFTLIGDGNLMKLRENPPGCRR